MKNSNKDCYVAPECAEPDGEMVMSEFVEVNTAESSRDSIMNSRQRRKQAAHEHNDRIRLMRDLSDLQSAIYDKHGSRVRAVIDNSNSSVLMEIARLRGILASDTPPQQAKRNDGISTTMLALAALAGMGVGSR